MSPPTHSPLPPPLPTRPLTPTYESIHSQYQHLLSHERAGVALERSLWISERALYKAKLAAAEATIASLRQELEALRSSSTAPPPPPPMEDAKGIEAKGFQEIDEKTANQLYEQARRIVYPEAQRSWPEEKIDEGEGDEGTGAAGGGGAGDGDDDGDDDGEGEIKLILKRNTNFGWAF